MLQIILDHFHISFETGSRAALSVLHRSGVFCVWDDTHVRKLTKLWKALDPEQEVYISQHLLYTRVQ
jgi:hypothetical protein